MQQPVGFVSVEIPREKTGKKATGKCIDSPKKFD
jgi:hypothetical protein